MNATVKIVTANKKAVIVQNVDAARIMKTLKQHIHENTVREGVEYHILHGIPLSECVFRPHSEGFYKFYVEARNQYSKGLIEVSESFDRELMETDIGETIDYNGEEVPLDIPLADLVEADDDVELNSPKRGGNKKFYVYVKNDKGNVIKIEFGDTTGLKAKIDDPEARKNFAARHQCDTKKDKTKAGYWACRLPYYAKQLGLSGGGNFFW